MRHHSRHATNSSTVRLGRWLGFILPGLALVTIVLMLRDAALNAELTITADPGYGQNRPGHLKFATAAVLIEAAGLMLIFRPWSWKATWPRLIMALVYWAPCTLLGLLAALHAGGILMLHALWTLTIGTHLAVMVLALTLKPD